MGAARSKRPGRRRAISALVEVRLVGDPALDTTEMGPQDDESSFCEARSYESHKCVSRVRDSLALKDQAH
jgi:phage head maturation protease